MSRIVDRDRGRSVLMSGIVWCYLESLVTTRLRAFHRISLSNQGQRMWPGDTGPGANKWFLPRQPLKTPFQQPFVKGENKKRTEVKIYFGYLLRVQQCIYLTPCVLATGETIYLVTDNTWGHGARERRVESVSLTPRTVSSLAQTGIMLPANNETRVTRQLASQETR